MDIEHAIATAQTALDELDNFQACKKLNSAQEKQWLIARNHMVKAVVAAKKLQGLID